MPNACGKTRDGRTCVLPVEHNDQQWPRHEDSDGVTWYYCDPEDTTDEEEDFIIEESWRHYEYE